LLLRNYYTKMEGLRLKNNKKNLLIALIASYLITNSFSLYSDSSSSGSSSDADDIPTIRLTIAAAQSIHGKPKKLRRLKSQPADSNSNSKSLDNDIKVQSDRETTAHPVRLTRPSVLHRTLSTLSIRSDAGVSKKSAPNDDDLFIKLFESIRKSNIDNFRKYFKQLAQDYVSNAIDIETKTPIIEKRLADEWCRKQDTKTGNTLLMQAALQAMKKGNHAAQAILLFLLKDSETIANTPNKKKRTPKEILAGSEFEVHFSLAFSATNGGEKVILISKSGTQFTISNDHAQLVTTWQKTSTDYSITVDASDETLTSLIRLLKIAQTANNERTRIYRVGKITRTLDDDTRLKLLNTATSLGFPNFIVVGLKNNQEYFSIADYGPSMKASENVLNIGNHFIDNLAGLAVVAHREPAITKLYLNNNFITVPFEMPWQKLTLLSLTHNLLRGLPDLSGLPALQEFRCAHNLLTSVREGNLDQCVALTTLDFEGNQLKLLDTLPPKLKYLFVADNPLNPKEKRNLRKKLIRQARKHLETSDHKPTKHEITKLVTQRSTGLELKKHSRRR
jgi:hypothetical protein